MNDQIPHGHFLMSRMIFLSAIWKKPPQYLRVFLWLIGKAVFQDGHTFKGHILKRGELITNHNEIADALSYCFNRAIIKPTLKEIRIMLSWLQSEGMILMKPMIDGTLPNQGRPQEGTTAGTFPNKGKQEKEGRERMNKTPRDFSSEISTLKDRYPDQETINQAFQAISSTRKSNRIADSVKLSILKAWERYPVESVMAGIRTYLEKGYADQGKNEKYLLGIIRNNAGKPLPGILSPGEVPGRKVRPSTGDRVLDDHYRGQGWEIRA